MREWLSGSEGHEVRDPSGRDVGRSFDELARGLAEGTMPRRRALRLLGAALVGTVMASMPAIAQAAPCRPGQFQCGRKCCPEGARCMRGDCLCPAGQNLCPAGTLQGIDTCCPEGFGCCVITGAQGEVISSICCPGGICHADLDTNVLTCATG